MDMTATLNPSNSQHLRRINRAIVWNQALWTAGHSLTTGGFLVYFGSELGAGAFLIAVLLIVPETAGIAGLAARWVIQRVGNRKRIWIVCSLLARVASLGIPLVAFPSLRPDAPNAIVLMIACLAVSQALQSIAYLSYLSWLADLVAEDHWGRFFAVRNIAKISVLLVVPVAGGYLRDWWRQDVPPDAALLAYVGAFVAGASLLLASLVPLLPLPNVVVRSETIRLPEWRVMRQAFANRSLRFLLLHNWWLAFANGLTQAAFFRYMYGPLGIGLGTYYLLFNTMNLAKIPVSALAGMVCDRRGNKAPLFWGVLTASSGLVFWLAATPQQWWWLFAAHILWGGFASANIAGRNLVLKFSPRGDNSAQLALFRQVGGLLAGVSGLLGGLWLQSLQTAQFGVQIGGYQFEGFQLMFLVSLLGRWSSVLWILPIRETEAEPTSGTRAARDAEASPGGG